jgi:hypothetical protein
MTMIDSSTLMPELRLIKDRVDASTMIEAALKQELQSIMDRLDAIMVKLDKIDNTDMAANRSEVVV